MTQKAHTVDQRNAGVVAALQAECKHGARAFGTVSAVELIIGIIG
jgi:hypothetical protein